MKLADFVSIAPGTVFRVRRALHIDYGDCVALVTRGSLVSVSHTGVMLTASGCRPAPRFRRSGSRNRAILDASWMARASGARTCCSKSAMSSAAAAGTWRGWWGRCQRHGKRHH